MSDWTTSPQSGDLGRLLNRADGDSRVLGVVLTGSRAREGMATTHSDVDVYVVLAEPHNSWRTTHSAAIDVPVCTIDQLREVPGPHDGEGWWDRYSFTHSQVLRDKTAGELARLVDAWGRLSGAESKLVIETYLDGYLNFVYRSLKSHRDGRLLAARLDAVESLAWGLTVVFALERRVRPYNKYLRWELERYPLDQPAWQAELLLPQLEAILDSGDPVALRAVFASVEEAARVVGFGTVIDDWGDDLNILHGIA